MRLLGRCLTVALAAFPQIVSAQIGPEFLVNTYTTLHQGLPAVAADGAGNFTVVWESGHDGASVGIFGQRYDSAGSPLGAEFQVNTYTTNGQIQPAVAVDGAGNFTVVWTSFEFSPFVGQDGDGAGVFGQLYDSTGSPVGGEFQVNTYTTFSQREPVVAADGAGNFVVVWESPVQDGDFGGIFGQRYDSAGSPLGGEFQVNTHTTSNQLTPAVAADGAGNFIVVWTGHNQDGGGFGNFGVFGQRYDNAGSPLGGEFQVNTYTTGRQYAYGVATDGAGNFVVVWSSFGQDGDLHGIFGQRYDSAGSPLGAEFQVNTYTPGIQNFPSVAADGAGNFVVAWASYPGDSAKEAVFAQRYDSAGDPVGNEFLVNTYTRSFQINPAVAASGGGSFIVTWESDGQDGDSSGALGQRYDFGGRQTVVGGLLKLTQRASGQRTVTVRGREGPSSSTILGDPLTYGATVQVIAHGDANQAQTFSLPPGAAAPGGVPGWQPIGTGWRYSDRLGVNGPVRSASVRAVSNRGIAVKVSLKGTASSPPPGVGLVPPGNGIDGGLLLAILGPGGATYCVSLGGANGGTVTNSASTFTVRRAATETGCPSP